MDKLDQYRDIVENALQKIVNMTENAFTKVASLKDKLVIDRRTDNYLIVREGWYSLAASKIGYSRQKSS